jgi:hypothetical protein
MKHTITAHEFEYECEFEHEAGQAQTWTDPGYPEIYHLVSAHYEGVQVLPMLDPAIIHELEHKMLEMSR